MVTVYLIVSESRRSHRSTRCRFSWDPWKFDFGEKFVTSTTSVLPSQRPRESPHHRRKFFATCGVWVSGVTRIHTWHYQTSVDFDEYWLSLSNLRKRTLC